MLRTKLKDAFATRKGRAAAAPQPAPRYDEIFAEGQRWLDELAGEPLRADDLKVVGDAEELVPDDSDPFEDLEDFDDDTVDELLAHEPEGAEARFTLQLGQAVAFAEAAMDLVRAGRPPCPLCGRPIGTEGHACPRWN